MRFTHVAALLAAVLVLPVQTEGKYEGVKVTAPIVKNTEGWIGR
jgi:hypothetical protein